MRAEGYADFIVEQQADAAVEGPRTSVFTALGGSRP